MCRAAQGELAEARLALERWDELERACEHRRSDRERRFRRRAYERARDRALIALAMHPPEPTKPSSRGPRGSSRKRPSRRIATA